MSLKEMLDFCSERDIKFSVLKNGENYALKAVYERTPDWKYTQCIGLDGRCVSSDTYYDFDTRMLLFTDALITCTVKIIDSIRRGDREHETN